MVPLGCHPERSDGRYASDCRTGGYDGHQPRQQQRQPGGSFLIESPRPEDVFTPAELTDDQRLIGQTAEEFVAKEVMPLIPELEQHKDGPDGRSC